MTSHHESGDVTICKSVLRLAGGAVAIVGLKYQANKKTYEACSKYISSCTSFNKNDLLKLLLTLEMLVDLRSGH